MPRKSKTETTTTIKPTATKTKSKAQSKAKTKATATSKDKTKSVTKTPKHSEIILEYTRFGNIGYSTVHETVDISNVNEKELKKRISALFHFLRNTKEMHRFDSYKTATFQINSKPVLSLTQKSGDYENQDFSFTRYKADGTKQSTRKYPYNKTKNLILQF